MVLAMGMAGESRCERLRLEARRINCFRLGERENPLLG